MEIINDYPPIWDEVNAAGLRPDPETVIFTYGNKIYVPSGKPIADFLVAHEEVHGKQQEHSDEGAHKWWNRYLIDPYFRVEQEAHAYAAQYDFMCRKIKDRNQRHKLLMDLGRILSSPLYGETVTQSAAMKMIKDLTHG